MSFLSLPGVNLETKFPKLFSFPQRSSDVNCQGLMQRPKFNRETAFLIHTHCLIVGDLLSTSVTVSCLFARFLSTLSELIVVLLSESTSPLCSSAFSCSVLLYMCLIKVISSKSLIGKAGFLFNHAIKNGIHFNFSCHKQHVGIFVSMKFIFSHVVEPDGRVRGRVQRGETSLHKVRCWYFAENWVLTSSCVKNLKGPSLISVDNLIYCCSARLYMKLNQAI